MEISQIIQGFWLVWGEVEEEEEEEGVAGGWVGSGVKGRGGGVAPSPASGMGWGASGKNCKPCASMAEGTHCGEEH